MLGLLRFEYVMNKKNHVLDVLHLIMYVLFSLCHVNVVFYRNYLDVNNKINKASKVGVLFSTTHTTPITRIMVKPR